MPDVIVSPRKARLSKLADAAKLAAEAHQEKPGCETRFQVVAGNLVVRVRRDRPKPQ